MKSDKLKRLVTEFLIYAIVIVVSSVSLIQVTKYKQSKPTQYYLNGKLTYAMLSVPVPVSTQLEGQTIDYKITCTMKKGALECKENS